jgi:hypothetical protein
MRSVYVLGAGFSHNFNRETFPLIRDFLKTAKSSFIYQPEDQHQQLASVISKYFADPLYPDLEKVLSFLSAPALYDRTIPHEHPSIMYDELVEVIVRVLSVASESKADSDNASQTFNRFALRLVDGKTTVITFNYDLLIENLLLQTHQWGPHDGYGVDIPLVDDAMPTPRHTFVRQPSQLITGPNVSLLKLHGSINWGSPTIFQDKSDVIYRLPMDEGVSMDDFTIRTDIGSPFTMYFKPAIIPPILDKSFWLRNPTFRVLWNMAMEAIDNADAITFVGYSLPLTDFMAEFMFRQGINSHSKERSIVVVDPRVSELSQRYRDVFGSVPLVDISFKDCDFVSYIDEVLPSSASKTTQGSGVSRM